MHTSDTTECCVVLATLLFATSPASGLVPTFEIDLDLQPDLRFKHVATHFKDMAPFVEQLAKFVAQELQLPDLEKNPSPDFFRGFLPAEMADEIKGIANALQISEAYLLALNLAFEAQLLHSTTLVVHCTWAIGTTKGLHGRGLEAASALAAQFLRKATTILDFTRNGTTIYSGISFAFFVGLLTGQRNNGYTVSVSMNSDTVDSQQRANWLKDDKLKKLPLGYAVRNALSTNENYTEAVAFFRRELVSAPAFITLTGSGPNEVCTVAKTLTVDASSQIRTDLVTYSPGANAQNVSGTALWQADDATHIALLSESAKKVIQEHFCSLDSLQEVMSKPPVTKPNTVFTTTMEAGNSDRMVTYTSVSTTAA